MKYLFLCLLAPLLFAGCNKSEPEPAIVIAPAPQPAATVEVAPLATPTAAGPTNTIIIVQPTAQPKVVIVTPSVTASKPAPKPAPTAKAAPTAKPAPTATSQPALKPTAKPTPKPVAKPIAKPKPTAKPRPRPTAVAAVAQPEPVLIVRAQVVSTSTVPDPSTVAYSDSLVFSKYRVVSVEKGSYQEKEILVAQWGMKGKKLTPAARLRAGDATTLRLVPLDDMPKLERIMRNDDTGDYDSMPYFALEK